MTLKVLMLRKKLDDAQKAMAAVDTAAEALNTRESELAAAINEAQTDEEKATVEAAVTEFENDKTANNERKAALAAEISSIEAEIAQLEEKQNSTQRSAASDIGRKVDIPMNTRTRFCDMTFEQRSALVQREDMKEFLGQIRSLRDQKRGVSNGGLLIPEVMLSLVYSEILKVSQILPYVNLVEVSGTARQNIMGSVPKAVWTEACGNLNELELGFNDIEVDGYKVGGFIKVCNALLEDNDVNLAAEIIKLLGASIAVSLDQAMIFGTGTKMPLGIATRLAQTSQPESYPATAPAWTDLHTTNILTLNINSSTGAAFFAPLIEALGVAKKKGIAGDGKLFWVMSRKTKIAVLSKALAFDSGAALKAGISNEMPVIGGTIIEMESPELQDYEIIGGFGAGYLLSQRQGARFGSSDQQFFTNDQTVFKGTARYDGKPVFGENFVIVNFANTSPTTTATFPTDYANTDLGVLGVTAANGSAAGDTVLTVTGAEASGTTLKYKIGSYALNTGDTVKGWTALTSGTTQITCAAGKTITVAELDGSGRVIKTGSAVSNPKA